MATIATFDKSHLFHVKNFIGGINPLITWNTAMLAGQSKRTPLRVRGSSVRQRVHVEFGIPVQTVGVGDGLLLVAPTILQRASVNANALISSGAHHHAREPDLRSGAVDIGCMRAVSCPQ